MFHVPTHGAKLELDGLRPESVGPGSKLGPHYIRPIPEKPKPDKAQYPINVQKKFFAINPAVLGPNIPSIYGPRGQRKSES